MKKKLPYALAGLMLLCLLCTACGGDPSLQDDPNDGLGGGVSEDTVNDFSDYIEKNIIPKSFILR